MKGDFFKGIMQWEYPTLLAHIEKNNFKLPVFYYDNTSMTAIYTADTKKVLKYLPHRPEVSPLIPGGAYPAILLHLPTVNWEDW